MQSTNTVILIRPASFSYNLQTAASNTFQKDVKSWEKEILNKKVLKEFDDCVAVLKSAKINVLVFDDTESPIKPDAIFPNNWVSFQKNGKIILYPMFAENRRLERRVDIIEQISKMFSVNEITDLSYFEKENKFLEGTGSIVFDHTNKIAYACLSPRTDKEIFLQLCNVLNYQGVYFIAKDANHKEIYHTNVMLSVGEKFVVICAESIIDKKERSMVLASLEKTGHETIDISLEQMNAFCGNMLAITNTEGKSFLALSKTSFDAFRNDQKTALENHTTLLPISIPTMKQLVVAA